MKEGKTKKKKLYTIPGSSNYFQRRAMPPSNSSEIWFTSNRQTIQLRRAGTSLKFNERRSFAGLLACACRVKLCRNKSGRDEWIERMLCSLGPSPSSADTLPTPLYRIIYSVSSGVIKKNDIIRKILWILLIVPRRSHFYTILRTLSLIQGKKSIKKKR